MRELKILKDQLESVRKAILEIESGSQSFELESNGARRKATRAEISLLYKRESELLIRIRRLTGGLQTLRFGD